MSSNPPTRRLRLFFFPLMAPGHLHPTVELAKLFARRGVHASILTTPSNAPAVDASIRRAAQAGHPVDVLPVDFPAGHLPGPDNMAAVTSADMQMDFILSASLLREPFARLLAAHRPDAVATDMFFPWSAEVAEEFGVPRLLLGGAGFFALCVSDSVFANPPRGGDAGAVYAVPGIPHRIELGIGEVPDRRLWRPDFAELFAEMKQSERRSFGVVVNSFYELEPEYADHYRKDTGMRAWNVGPVSLCNDEDEKAARGGGGGTTADHGRCLNWLAKKKPGSVLYVCFGSLCRFTAAQMQETALGLEASDCPFLWVVRSEQGRDWVPEGFEERLEGTGKGMMVWGWAPQILLLGHGAVGGFLTHCGWNSCLEAITAGVPMVTWPLFADQFYNEKLLTEVLRVAAGVGGERRYSIGEDRPLVAAAEVARGVGAVMGGGGSAGEGMRRRARELAEAARRAVGEGGSSYDDLGRLIAELRGTSVGGAGRGPVART